MNQNAKQDMKYKERLERLREKKLSQTKEKLKRMGYQDEDDYGMVLPPEDFTWKPPATHPDGSFFGASMWGKNFRSLMEHHPVYIDPDDAFAGRWMFMLSRMRPGYKLSLSPFPADYSELREQQLFYGITGGIGKDAHFSPDYAIGLELGWPGLLKKVQDSMLIRSGEEAQELLAAEEDALLGIMDLIRRSADAAEDLSNEEEGVLKENLLQMAELNRRLLHGPPAEFREACQWIIWFNIATRNYNRDGAGGQLDELLRPYYEADSAAGRIGREDAVFYLACFLLNDTHYYQIGGPDETGKDLTSELSYMVLEAADALKSSCNLTIRCHDGTHDELIDQGIQCLLENKLGFPRFSGDKALVEGFVKNGFSEELARKRIALGCNWMSIPGREYALNDVIKINIARVFEVAFKEASEKKLYSTEDLFSLFKKHLSAAVGYAVEGIDFHLAHQYRNEPELLLNLLCYGPIEKGVDASRGGVEYYNMGIDGAGLGTVADSFAAIEQRVEREKRLTWEDLSKAVGLDFSGIEGEKVQPLMKGSQRFGGGATAGDAWARRITELFTKEIRKHSRPGDRIFIPGWFSWADTLRFGKEVGATPNGRKAGSPITHGANPAPGYRKDGALTAFVKSVAAIQPGYGNTAPLQLELDPSIIPEEKQVETIRTLILGHFELGGTLVNVNVIDAETIKRAHENPADYPDLVVRVTGFTAYFANLSPEFRKLVVERAVNKEVD